MANLIPDKIIYSTLVRAPADTVYDGFATAQGLDGWFTQGSSIDARPGGHMLLRRHEFGADRVTEEARMDIMGVLVELLVPTQNNRFLDHFIDYPVDLSEVMFIATANNTGNLATAVMDRLEPIQMPSYTDEEKSRIATDFLFPRALSEAGMDPSVITIDPVLWPQIIRPLGYDSGIRTLNRTIDGIVRKVAFLIVTGQNQTVHLTPDNIKQFLPKW